MSRGRVGAEQRSEQLVSALPAEGINPELVVAGPAAPPMLVLGAIVHEQEDGRCGHAVEEAVEDGLSLAVDPVEVLEDQDQRLHPALAEEERLDGLVGPAAPVGRVQGAEGAVLGQSVEQSADGRDRVLQGPVEHQHFAAHLFRDGAGVVARLGAEVRLEEIDHRKVRRRLAVGDRRALED